MLVFLRGEMTTHTARDKITIFIRGANASSRRVSRKSITISAMNNAKTSLEIEGHHYSDSDWSKIMYLAEQLEKVI